MLVIAFILSVSLLPVGSFAALALAWSLLVAVSFVSRIGPIRMVKAAFVALPFIIAAFPLLFTKEGDPIGTVDLWLFSLTLSGEGLRMVATIMLKSWISVQAAALLIFTTRFHDLLEGLSRLRLPKLMVSIISLMYRYRQATPPGVKRPPVRWQARVVGNMVGALFIRSYERSERVYLAMQSRGYTGQVRHLHDRPFPAAQWGALAAGIVLLAAFQISARVWLPHS